MEQLSNKEYRDLLVVNSMNKESKSKLEQQLKEIKDIKVKEAIKHKLNNEVIK